MQIQAKEIQLVDIDSLVLNPKNNNKHPKEQIDRLAKLIQYQGFRNPVIVSKRTGFVLAGHGRIEAAKLAGLKEVPAMFQDFENEAQEYAYLTSDNAIASWAELDLSAVNTEMLDLGPDFDIDLLGIKDFVIEPIEKFEPQSDEDAVPDVVYPITRKGDIWLLGNHRLMCGDSTMIDDVEKLMNGEKADMVFTDPPYGVSYTGGLGDNGNGIESNKREMIKNDDIDLYYEAVTTANHFSNGPVFMFYADTVPFQLYAAVKDVGAKIVAMIVWKKKGGYGALGASYKQNHEPCLIWLPKGKKLNFIGETTENRVWEMDKDGLNKLHPTQKPVAIPKRAIGNHEAEIVLDIFGGSGSTMIACEELKRKARLMELDEKYCDVIIKRWEQYTGKKATLELTGQTYEELKVERDGTSN
jgi:DNA modification methylase